VLHDDHINVFGYQEADADGHLVPLGALIRTSYGRDENPPADLAETDRHRILRRGISYGPEFQADEPAYPGGGPVPQDNDRGLLFLSHQGSIVRGFEFISRSGLTLPTSLRSNPVSTHSSASRRANDSWPSRPTLT
jgi:deferrochelatase/peroxidase EfeB